MTDEMGRKINAIDQKVSQMDKDLQAMKTNQAVRDVQFKAIEEGLGGLKRDIRWVLMILAAAVLTAAAQFVLRGGLTATGG